RGARYAASNLQSADDGRGPQAGEGLDGGGRHHPAHPHVPGALVDGPPPSGDRGDHRRQGDEHRRPPGPRGREWRPARARPPARVARSTGRAAAAGSDRPALKLAGAATYTPAAVARPGPNGPRAASPATDPGRQLLDTPAATSAAVIGLSQEISQLKAMV